MRLTSPTETLQSWLAATDQEIAALSKTDGEQTAAKRAHAEKVQGLIVAELRARQEEAA